MITQPKIEILTDREHVLKRTGIYCGSPKEEVIETHIYTDNGLEFKSVNIIPALNKIISEIIDNARDILQKYQFKNNPKIEVEYNNGVITVRDNGIGLPIVYNEEVRKWTPEIIYTQLRSGSNFNDEDRIVAGQNGMGCVLTSILSRKFSVDSCNGLKRYQQTFENSLAKINKPKITDIDKNQHYTEVTFEPNYDFFNASNEVLEYLPILINKMIIELSFCFPEINWTYNSKRISTRSLKQFLSSIHEIYEWNETENCRIGVFYSDTEFKQISFVNGLSTTRGGTHINYVSDTIVAYIREFIKRKHKVDCKPIDIKSKLFVFLSMRMINSQFDSQNKDYLSSQLQDFKISLDTLLTDSFLKSITKNEEIIFPIVEAYKLKQQVKENQNLKKITNVKKVKIDKYLPASEKKEWLCLTEGDAALGLISSVLGRKNFSYFPLKGKPLNSLEVSKSKILENDELKNIIQILNLRIDKDEQFECNYEKILICTDSDQDGISIKSLLLCFFYRFTKSLIDKKRIYFLQTPIVVAKQKGKVKYNFLTLEEYNKFKLTTTEKYDYSYKKGIGSNCKNELKTMFESNGLSKYLQQFELDETTEQSINEWMSKLTVDKRKEYLRDKEFDIGGV